MPDAAPLAFASLVLALLGWPVVVAAAVEAAVAACAEAPTVAALHSSAAVAEKMAKIFMAEWSQGSLRAE